MPRSRSSSGRLKAVREIVLDLVTTGPARGWLHTHGLAAHGKPELEIRNIPVFVGAAAAGLLNDVADYVLNTTRPVAPGDLVRWGRVAVRLAEARPDPAGGYDPEHYVVPRLQLVDAPEDPCLCDDCCAECARERATSLPH
jgi:hypothetical protein